VPRIAGREGYLAAYHAAAALLIERSGSTAGTHRGLRAQFAHIARDEPGIDRSLTEFPARAYELKSLADYGTGPESAVSVATAEAAIEAADRFVSCIARLLGNDIACAC
jgi:uncharacterized protein (UPF0332 family)